MAYAVDHFWLNGDYGTNPPTVQGVSHATGTPDATISTPTQTTTGALLVLWVSNDNGAAAAPTVTGFTQQLQQGGNNHRSWVFTRTATSGDAGGAGSYTVDFASGAAVAASMLSITGVATTAFEGVAGATIVGSATHTTASGTPSADQELAVAFFAVDITTTPDGDFWSLPSGWTQQFEYDGTNGTRHVVQGGFTKVVSPAASTSATSTSDQSTDGSNAILFAIPAATGPVTYQKTGTPTAGTKATGADILEAVETGAATTTALATAADTTEYVETGTTVADTLATGTDEETTGAVTHEKTGTTTADTVAAATDILEAAETGTATADTVASGTATAEAQPAIGRTPATLTFDWALP